MRTCLLLSALVLASACNTQRVPGPMERSPEFQAIGQGMDYVPGPQEVVVVRHGDLVSIRRPGATAGFPLRFYDKRLRLGSGGWVLTGTGGRAEVLWPGTTSSVMLFDNGAAMVGEPSRAEAILSLNHASRARINLAPGHHIAIVGGAELEGDPTLDSGPFEFETVARDRVSLINNGRTLATIRFRTEELILGPGEMLELPILPGGTGPISLVPGTYAVGDLGALPGPDPLARGEVEQHPNAGGLEVEASEPATVTGLGVEVELDAGETVIFETLGVSPQG